MTLVLLLIAFSLVIAADDAYLRKRNISDGEMLLTLANYLLYRISSGVMFVFLVLILYLIIIAEKEFHGWIEGLMYSRIE